MSESVMCNIPQVNQVGVVVHDVEKAAKFMEECFGIKFITFQMPEAKAHLRGKEVNFITKIGLARVGNIDLELMQIVQGEHIVKEFLDRHGPGIHHLGIYVDDLNKEVKDWTDRGGKVVQKTAHPDGIGTAYLDTENELGSLYIELVKL
ncbi:MAG TPA: VOC family protein [Spirochaetota bacterium]|nr:VOC family protein [Spirochaetota bacterium]